jgi:osmotically-inducible protein OsmY
MDHDDNDSTEYEGAAQKPEEVDIRAVAQISVYLEHEIGVDLRRIHIQVTGGIVHLQGSVSTRQQKNEIEEELPKRPFVSGLVSHLIVREEKSSEY